MSERPATPNTFDTVRAMLEESQLEMHVALPGRVHGAPRWTDSGDLVVDVEPLIQHPVLQADGSYLYEPYPILPSVPVLQLSAGPWFLSIPVPEGSYVLVVFNDAAVGHWRTGSGDVTHPGDLRRHHLSHGVAIPGFRPLSAALPKDQGVAGDRSQDLVLGKDGGTRIAVKNSGEVSMAQDGATVFRIDASGNVHLATDAGGPLSMASPVDQQFTDLRTAISGWSPVSGDGGAALKTALTAWLAGVSNVGATKVNGT